MCSLLNFSDKSKHSLVSSFVVVVVGLVEGRGVGIYLFIYFYFILFYFIYFLFFCWMENL